MNFVRAIAALVSVGPLLAQYGGPAILARGQSPGAMSSAQIDFRPYVSVTGTYDTGLNGVAVDANGSPVNDGSFGVTLGFGVSGAHSWKHTRIGLNYNSGYSHYAKSFYDGVSSQYLQFSLSHQLSRHALFSLSTNAALYGSNRATPTLSDTVGFDPTTTLVSTNDFFDNRTITVSNQASVTLQRSTRLSISLGVDGFLTRRRSSALFGSNGVGAQGDIQYRLSRRSTVGVSYAYMRYSFTGISGGTDAHTASGSYSLILSRSVQFSGYAGATKYENVFVQIVPIDPAIAAVIGISSAQRVTYLSAYTPSLGARLTKVVPRGSISLTASHGLNPGNGLFLSSTSTDVGAGYGYTGLRRWSISAWGNYDRSTSQGNVLGTYGSYTASTNVSRQLMRMTHGVFTLYARKYDSGDFKNYNKWAYGLSLGLTFAPGDVPIRFW